jgi:AraC-like DNA-binding protein
VDRFTVAVVVDLDDYLADTDSRGPQWADQAVVSANDLVRAACGADAGTAVEAWPPDSWLVTISRPTREAIAAEAHTLAARLRDEIATNSTTTASVAISTVVEGRGNVQRAAREAKATLGRKTLGGTGRVLATVEHRSFVPPDIAQEVTGLLRADAVPEAVARVERWIGYVLHRQADPAVLFRVWLPGLVLDIATFLDPRRNADGSPNWHSTLRHVPIADLADLAGMHERSHLHRWLQTCLTRLATLGRRDAAASLADRAEELLRSRFTDPGLTLVGAAAVLAVSPFHLAHVLQRERDCTFRGYLTGLRVRQAMALLSQDELSIADIGRRCGFQTTRQFRATLQREVGCAPSQLRRRTPRLPSA